MARAGAAKKAPKPKTAEKAPAGNDVPDVYQEMLAQAVSSSPTQKSEDGRLVKKRRVGGRIITQSNCDTIPHLSDQSSNVVTDGDLNEPYEDVPPVRQQVMQNDSEDSADSDMDWEEVNLKEDVKAEGTPEPESDEPGELNIVLGGDGDENNSRAYGRPKRKPLTAEGKKIRLEIHKMHLCSLLVHVYIRNHWCNDVEVHSALRSLLTTKTISYLSPDENLSQFQRSRSFMDGLTQASESFRAKFNITARGMRKSMWADGPETLANMQPPDDIDLPMRLADFRDAAASLIASRDVGAQLFCALLRSAGVDARLVCSLQPLPFQSSQKVSLPHLLHASPRVRDQQGGHVAPIWESDTDTKSDGPGSAYSKISSVTGRSRYERGEEGRKEQIKRNVSPVITPAKVPLRSKRKLIHESKYPIYWVEAFNEAVQKWIPIDPLVTRSIAKPSKLEPPAGEPESNMSYVVAFEDDRSALDVTRRYVRAYNAKTRRDRVEATEDGEKWWRRVMKMYRRSQFLDRDQVEDAELAAKEAAEPMPKNLQDFKDHPYYALERHLKRHEVIHPKREVGKVGARHAGSSNALEPIYRRRDVHMVKSADKWYRMGREIKPGEQPLKRVPARRTRDQISDADDQDGAAEGHAGTALYAAHQTRLYSAPPVKNGRIPKNIYGNLDIYVSSMVPPGGVHIPHTETSRAARIMGIDYADAVTGFVFKGRHGTAVSQGAVVASEYGEAVEEVIKALDDERTRLEEERRSAEALRIWKRFFAGLRIRQRIEGYEVEGERDTRVKREMEEAVEDKEDNEGGGFLPDQDLEDNAQSTAGRISGPRGLPDLAEDEGGGFTANESDEESVTEDEWSNRSRQVVNPNIHKFENEGGSGFLVNDGDEEAMRNVSVRPDETDNSTLCPMTAITGHPKTNPKHLNVPEGGGDIVPEEFETGEPMLPEPKSDNLRESGVGFHKYQEKSSSRAKIEEEASPNQALPESSDVNLEEARMLQQLYDSGGIAQLPLSTVGSTTSSRRGNIPEQETEDEQLSTASAAKPPSFPTSEAGEEVAEEAVGSEDDRGSLLSHDPDDEDADPEWLA